MLRYHTKTSSNEPNLKLCILKRPKIFSSILESNGSKKKSTGITCKSYREQIICYQINKKTQIYL